MPVSRRSALRAELGALDTPALAARLEGLAEERDDLDAAVRYGVRRLTALATAASRSVDERLDIEGLMALTKRSRSWIEHNGHRVPGRCQERRGGRVRWRKSAVLRWLAGGGC